MGQQVSIEMPRPEDYSQKKHYFKTVDMIIIVAKVLACVCVCLSIVRLFV